MRPCSFSLAILAVAGEGIGLGKKRISSWAGRSALETGFSFADRQVENLKARGRSSWKMGARIVKAAQGHGSWCLYLLALMVPIPSGITAGLYSIRSKVPTEKALPQPCFVLCASALQCCCGVAADHTALLSVFTCVHRAMLASAMLQLLIRSLQSQPTSF